MRNPSELYRFEADARPVRRVSLPRIGFGAANDGAPEPSGGVLLVMLDGFIDAGHVGHILANHLTHTGEPHVVASFEVDELLDFRGRRPGMTFSGDRWTSYDDPALPLYRLEDRDGTPYYLLAGPEPDYQWERFIAAVTQLIDVLGIELVVHTYGIPMAVPHTRPIGFTAIATDSRLIGEHKVLFGEMQVPASVSSLLHLRLGEAGRDAAGFAVHVPHYLGQAEFHDAALTALNAIVDLTGLNLPNDELVAKAGENRKQIAAELEANPEIAQAVTGLENQYDVHVRGMGLPNLLDQQESKLPSADELASDVEEFLRSVDGDA
ncbi:proteasome assembly chaperone family protein [Kribbia dieselivorans]|uniref:proteasome assembly chaperone family protein n=1 Tax=Kribbia dieselivorans TaxID=331526 RepID=UPI0009FAEF77|nr:PAC2 family protein [Kribbia dieselivorans]